MAKRILLLMTLGLASLACNMERVLNPSLPTYTPPAPQASGEVILPTLAPTATPTATPEPGARIESGDRAMFYGDWDTALLEYQTVLDTSGDPELQSAALLGIGRARLKLEQYPLALEALRRLADNFPDSPHRPQAFFFLGQVYDALDRYGESADAYQSYLDQRPGLIDFYVLERRADSLRKAGDYQNAINTYQAALQAPHLGDGLNIQIKIGDTYSLAGDHNTAIVVYQDVYNRTTNDLVKAQMDLYLGQSYTALGQPEQAYAAYLDAVGNYPRSYDSYSALVVLVEDGVPVDDLNRGLVDYFAGEYGVALAAFDRYLQAHPDDPGDTALHFRAFSQVALGQYAQAIETWERLIASYPFAEYWDDAYDEKAYTQWRYLNQYDQAIETLLSFVAGYPGQARAAQFLFFAGRIAEQDGNLERAAEIWARIGDEYPTSEYAYEGYFLAGISRYRLGDYGNAQARFKDALEISLDLEDQSGGYFWLGKAQQASGDQEGARVSWEQAAASDPTGYYSERARDVLAGRAPFTPPENYSFEYDVQAEKAAAEAWMRATFAIPEELDLNDLGPLLSDQRLWRGTELWRLGLYNEARLEFESLRQDAQNDPANAYRLANYFIEIGLYRSGIIAARQVLDLAGMDDAGTMNAPTFFNRLRFGVYYDDLVIPVAQSHGFDPLFFYAVLRQESLFEGFVTSAAGARGLMQIIPSTGESIAANSGWPPNFTPDDLYRPLVSVTLGADYLASQRNHFDGDIYAALAAYNGGPGNATAWRGLAQGDPDLFLEVVRFRETRQYLRSIYELFTIYRNLYQTPP